MTVRDLLSRHAGARARGRATRLAGRIVLFGGLLAAVALLLERVGAGVPFVHLPGPSGAGEADRFVWFLAVSIAGLVQGAVLLALVFAAALLARWTGGYLLRPRPARVAAELDRALGTDRFASALEAAGPFAPLVARRAVEHAPPPGVLGHVRSPRRERWLRRLVVALVVVVALAPGTAPGADGDARVAGEPDVGHEERALELRLVGEKETYGPREPVPVQVIAEARAAPDRELDLPVRIVIDDGEEIRTKTTLFLAAGVPGVANDRLDLRALAPEGLEPGEHTAVARAGDAESNVYVFRIEGPGEGGAEPPPEPPEPQEKPRPQGGPQGGGDAREKPRYVEPLVRDGPTVRKRAKVPIEVPGGGVPEERPLDQAWPELERRKEAALERPGLSPAARKLVREYFDRLRPAGNEGR